MHTFHFDDQYHTHQSYGYSIAPGGQEIVGDQEAFLSKKGKLPLRYSDCTLHDVVAHISRALLLFTPCQTHQRGRCIFSRADLNRRKAIDSSVAIMCETGVHVAGDSIFTQSAPAKRQQTAAERKAERRAKLAELADVDPDQPWALQVIVSHPLLNSGPPSSDSHVRWSAYLTV